MKLKLSFALAIAAMSWGCGGSPSGMTTVPTADFALQVSAQTLFVPIGFNSSSFQISIVPTSGFTQPVSVSMTGLPQGVNTTPSAPFTISSGSSQTLVFNAPAGVTANVQQISVVATSGALTHTASVSLSIAQPVYAYVNDPNSANIIGYSVDANTGAMTKLSAPVATLNASSQVLVATESAGTFLFMVTATGNYPNIQSQLLSYRVDSATGLWVPVEDRVPAQSTWEQVLGIHPSGNFLYTAVVDQQTNDYCIAAYRIDPTTGHLTLSSCSPGGTFVNSFLPMVLPPPGNLAYLNVSGSVQEYAINQSDGSLTPVATTPLIPQAELYAADPLGRAIYVLPGNGFPCFGLQSWAIDANSGVLNLLGTVNSDLACVTWSLSFSADGRYGYEGAMKKILDLPTTYRCPLDPTTGKLIFDGTVANVPENGTANYTDMIFEPSQGRFVIVVNRFIRDTSASSDLSSVPYNPATGDLGAAVITTPIPYGSLVAVVAPNQ
jgi:6-phosphogluconolactonase (cycloisomerase 2 family)